MHDPDKLDLKHELGRKAIHLTSIVIILVYVYYGKEIVLSFMAFVLSVFLIVEYFRIEWGFKLPVLDRFLRAHEKHVLGGEIFFMTGAFIAIAVFTKEIAIAAILMTTFGDMTGALFGKMFGKHKIPKLEKKTIEGSTAEFFVNLLIGYLVLIHFTQGLLHPGIIIIIMALTATAVETAINKIDDNLIIPIFAGGAGEILVILFKFTGG